MDLAAGYELRAPTSDDLDAAADVLIADHFDDAGQIDLDAGFVREEWSRAGFDLATDAWLVLEGTGAIVGYGQVMREPELRPGALVAGDGRRGTGRRLTANVWGDRGWVNEVGVLAPCRGRWIAAALLRRSFATFALRGLRSVMLNVDAETPTGATALYELVGMRVVKRWDLWERSSGRSP